MNEIEIKRHSFDLAKNRLKEFSEKTEAELAIDKVKTDGGLFGLGDHKVTGYELNRRLESIQGHLIDVNSTNNRTIKEFKEVYNALDALDKDYIASIVASVKAIEKTSNDVRTQQGTLKQHNEKLASQQNKLHSHQIEIEKNVANITKIVTALKTFKEKLDSYKHLTDIDKIWSDCKTIRNEIQVVSDSITALSKKTTNDIANANSKNKALVEQVNKDILTLRKEADSYKNFFSDLAEKIEDTAKRLDEQIPTIQYVLEFVNQMSNITHLSDIDSMWADVSDAKESINSIKNELHNVNDGILQMKSHFEQLDAFVAVLKGYIHLQDIDSMWDDLSNIKTEIKEIHKNIINSEEEIQKHQRELERLNIESVEQKRITDTLSQNQTETKEYAKTNRELITELQEFRGEVDSLEHLVDVDSLWEQGNVLKMELADTNNSVISLQQKTVEIDNEIADKTEKMQYSIASLERKLKYAYFVAGGALGLAVVELLLALTGVI